MTRSFRSMMGTSEMRLLSYQSGPEAFSRPNPELQSMPEAQLPPELLGRYRQSMDQLAGVLREIEQNGVPPTAMMSRANNALPYPFGMFPDGPRPYRPLIRPMNRVSGFLDGSSHLRAPWNFVPSRWSQNRNTFVPRIGIANVPYGVPPRYAPLAYNTVQYPLPSASYRLPSTWQSGPQRFADPVYRDDRGNFPMPPAPLSYEAPASVAPSTNLSASAAGPRSGVEQMVRSSLQFTYDGPPQAITLAFQGTMIPLQYLPEDGQTIVDPRGFQVSRRGNQYSLVYARS